MIKSLFSFGDTPLLDNTLPQQSEYKWANALRTFEAGGHTVLISPSNGGWAAFDGFERRILDIRDSLPRDDTSEFLYRKGLCSKNSHILFKNKNIIDDKLYFFELAVTTCCNLRCRYCFANASSEGLYIDKEKAAAFIDRIAEYIADERVACPVIVEFTGGEPLLNFPIIRYTVEYAKKTYNNLNLCFCLQTNLTLLTDKMIEFFRAYKIGIGISLDGFKAIQDKQRPFLDGGSSYKTVESKIFELNKKYPENPGGVIAVITDDNVDLMPEIALLAKLFGFRDIVLRPISKLGRGDNFDGGDIFMEKYVTGLFKILNSVITPFYEQTGEFFNERSISLTFKHLLRPERPFMCERTPCGAGRNICVVNPDGNVYACNQSVDEKLRLGNVLTDSFSDMTKSNVASMYSNRTIDKIEACSNCAVSTFCNSPCAYGAYKKYGDILGKSPECALMKSRFVKALTGLLRNEFNLSVVTKLAELKTNLEWDYI